MSGNGAVRCYGCRKHPDAEHADLSFSIELITEVAAFDGLRADWDELVASMEFPEIFYSWDWVSVFRRHFRSKDSLFIVVVRDAAGRIVGIAPLCVRRTRRFGLVVKVMETIVGDLSDYGNILVRRDVHRGQVVSGILNYLRTRSGEWDVLDLWDLCTRDATTIHILNLAPSYPDWSVRTHVSTAVAVCDLKASPLTDDRKEIGRIRNRMRRLQQRGLRLEIGCRDIDACWPQFCELHRKRWPESSFRDAARQGFYDDLKASPGLRDRIELSVLELDGRPAAMHFGFVDSHKVYYYMPAMDPGFRKEGVGTVLLYAMIEHYRKTRAVFDFMRGLEAYKLWYTDELDLNLRLVIYRSANLRAFAYNLAAVTRRYGVELGLPKAIVQLVRSWARKFRVSLTRFWPAG